MFEIIKDRCDALVKNFREIPAERKEILAKISTYIKSKSENAKEISLVYVCTHNSRRSHLGQVWAAVAAAYYGIEKVRTFSGGTEATAFNTNAIQALVSAGFDIKKKTETNNPVYEVYYGEYNFVKCF